VKCKEGSREWLLWATIDFEAFNSPVESIRIGETGSAFIIHRDGEFQTRLRIALALEEEFLRQFLARGGNQSALGTGEYTQCSTRWA
jgi:hypothetical protein